MFIKKKVGFKVWGVRIGIFNLYLFYESGKYIKIFLTSYVSSLYEVYLNTFGAVNWKFTFNIYCLILSKLCLSISNNFIYLTLR